MPTPNIWWDGMIEAPHLRKKAWERAKDERGLLTRIASRLKLRPQTVRRWFLEPGHDDRRELRDGDTLRRLAAFDLEPNDFQWLRGEKAARRRARAAACSEQRAAA